MSDPRHLSHTPVSSAIATVRHDNAGGHTGRSRLVFVLGHYAVPPGPDQNPGGRNHGPRGRGNGVADPDPPIPRRSRNPRTRRDDSVSRSTAGRGTRRPPCCARSDAPPRIARPAVSRSFAARWNDAFALPRRAIRPNVPRRSTGRAPRPAARLNAAFASTGRRRPLAARRNSAFARPRTAARLKVFFTRGDQRADRGPRAARLNELLARPFDAAPLNARRILGGRPPPPPFVSATADPRETNAATAAATPIKNALRLGTRGSSLTRPGTAECRDRRGGIRRDWRRT